MHLRFATTRDLHRLTEISTSSLIDDPTYDYLNPKRREFPEDNAMWMRFRLENLLYDKKATFLVVETEGEPKAEKRYEKSEIKRNQASPIIISYGVWIRNGDDAAAKQRMSRKNTWANMLDSSITKLSQWSINQKYTRRDADPARMAAKAAVSLAVQEKYFSSSPNWWSLELLVTHKDFRCRGAATKIVLWGLTEADHEKVSCGVEASPMGARLYERLGFVKLETWTVSVPGDHEGLDEDVMKRDANTNLGLQQIR